MKRWVRHLFTDRSSVRRRFPDEALSRIERTVKAAEAAHAGQIRVVIEASLDGPRLWARESAAERALEVFSLLRVWDTEHNNGVLIYLLLADRDVEIVADRGIHGRCGQEVWERICREMETAFRAGRFEEGIVAGVTAVGAELARHFPRTGDTPVNELPDAPVIL